MVIPPAGSKKKMSQPSTSPNEHPQAPAKNADPLKDVDECQKIIAAQAPGLLFHLQKGNEKSIRVAIEQTPVLYNNLRDLESAYRRRQADLDRCHDQMRSALSDRTGELGGLDQTVRQQRGEIDRLQREISDRLGELGGLDRRIGQRAEEASNVNRELTTLAHQRMDAKAKIDAVIETARRHEEFTGQEDSRLDDRAAELDIKQQDLTTREATLTRANDDLRRDIHELAVRQEQARESEDKNRKKSVKINKRLDVLAEYGAYKDKEAANSNTKIEELKMEIADLTGAKSILEERVAPLQQEAIRLGSTIAHLEGTIKDQDTRLSSLNTAEDRVIELQTGMNHLTCVILPQNEATLSDLTAELAEARKNAEALTSSNGNLDAKILNLGNTLRERDTQLSLLYHEMKSLQVTADQSSSELQSTKAELAVAKATIDSLQSENDQVRRRDLELQAQVDGCTAQHSDVGTIRRQVLNLQKEVDDLRPCKIDFNAAKRIQESSNAKIQDLEQQRNNLQQEVETLHRERDHLQQQRDKAKDQRDSAQQEYDDIQRERDDLEQQRDRAEDQRDSVRQEYDDIQRERDDLEQQRDRAEDQRDRFKDDHDRIAERLRLTNAQAKRFVDDVKIDMARKDEAIKDLRRRCQDAEKERDGLITEKDELIAVRNRLLGTHADLGQAKLDQSATLEQTQGELQGPTEQPRACHSSNGSSSRKRRHDQVDSEEEDLSPAEEADRTTRRLGKAPESTANSDAVGPSLSRKLVRDSFSPELLDTGVANPPRQDEPSTSSAGALMSTAVSRELGTTAATVQPSDNIAFAISVNDVKLLNISSDVIPDAVLLALRRKFQGWIVNSTFNWAAVQSSGKSRSCIEARSEKKKSVWDNGPEYACAICDQRLRLCVVVNSDEQVLFLPRKAARDEGKEPTDASYWRK